MSNKNNPVDPKYPFADKVNAEYPHYETFQAAFNDDRTAYPGDPQVGTTIKNTTIKWEDATSVQKLATEWYGESGMVIPDDMQAIMDANVGPNEFHNFSYAQWGLVAGSPADPSLKIVEAVSFDSANMVKVILQP